MGIQNFSQLLIFGSFIGLVGWTITNQVGRTQLKAKSREHWLIDGIGLTIQGIFIPLLQATLVYWVYQYLLPIQQGYLKGSLIPAFILSFVLVDYLYYWNHRLLHTKFLWKVHQVHHTVTQMDVLGTSRNTLWTILLIVYLLIPGIFSCWLRLWGAKVGRDVYWTTRLEIADRSLLEIGDRIRVTHYYRHTPCLEFLGRHQAISDLVGEKLQETFVNNALTLLNLQETNFKSLMPIAEPPHYILLLDSAKETPEIIAQQLDQALSVSHHYKRGRAIGQLAPPQVLISSQIPEVLVSHRIRTGSIWGGIKHPILATSPISTELLQELKLKIVQK